MVPRAVPLLPVERHGTLWRVLAGVFSKRDHEFESAFLQRRVMNEPCGCRRSPRGGREGLVPTVSTEAAIPNPSVNTPTMQRMLGPRISPQLMRTLRCKSPAMSGSPPASTMAMVWPLPLPVMVPLAKVIWLKP